MIQLRKASKQDLPMMVELSRIKRLDYEKAQPQFWCYAAEAEEMQLKWFEELEPVFTDVFSGDFVVKIRLRCSRTRVRCAAHRRFS